MIIHTEDSKRLDLPDTAKKYNCFAFPYIALVYLLQIMYLNTESHHSNESVHKISAYNEPSRKIRVDKPHSQRILNQTSQTLRPHTAIVSQKNITANAPESNLLEI